MVIRFKVPIEMHYTVILMGTSKVNSSLIVSHYDIAEIRFVGIASDNTDIFID